ncbi:hypothetical protein NDU88_001272 [Pleurodeles waltl]|uniref:Uncharacterized protein n=1 Tax=Pleurodeles waltl TaxID=8319 RepID=A0AAV7NEN4_PLEWA|nr:hypothetical protein NDU88_001272 [Pleurodeles waltl]
MSRGALGPPEQSTGDSPRWERKRSRPGGERKVGGGLALPAAPDNRAGDCQMGNAPPVHESCPEPDEARACLKTYRAGTEGAQHMEHRPSRSRGKRRHTLDPTDKQQVTKSTQRQARK